MTLLQQFIECGLVQFGWFPRNGHVEPVQCHFELLASYPDVLDTTTELLRKQIPAVDRLLCTPDAVPLGTALALKTGVPLVYSRGGENEPVFDLVGAYDIGHPAVLVTNVAGYTTPSKLLASARRVGLNVQSLAALVDYGMELELPVQSLFQLPAMVTSLLDGGVVPEGQVRAVEAWLRGLRSN